MLIYDYIEITEGLFNHITEKASCYNTVEHPNGYKEYYKAFGQTVIKVNIDNLTQYFINSAHPV